MAAGAGQRLHEQCPRPLAARALGHELSQVRHGVGRPAERKQQLGASLATGDSHLLQAHDCWLRERAVGQLGAQRPAPKPQCFIEQSYRPLAGGPTRLVDELLEAVHVDLAGRDVEPITVGIASHLARDSADSVRRRRAIWERRAAAGCLGCSSPHSTSQRRSDESGRPGSSSNAARSRR